jgi:hypothetical protein
MVEITLTEFVSPPSSPMVDVDYSPTEVECQQVSPVPSPIMDENGWLL